MYELQGDLGFIQNAYMEEAPPPSILAANAGTGVMIMPQWLYLSLTIFPVHDDHHDVVIGSEEDGRWYREYKDLRDDVAQFLKDKFYDGKNKYKGPIVSPQ